MKTNKTSRAADYNNKENGWHQNTDLCVNLKTILQSDCTTKPGKEYTGVLRHDVVCQDYHYDEHYTFMETLPHTAEKRNQKLFDGHYISVTRHADGSLHPYFKAMKVGAGFSIDSYALSVCNELRQALEGLVEE